MNTKLPPSEKNIVEDYNRLKVENSKLKIVVSNLELKITELESKISELENKKPYQGGVRID